MLTHIRLKKGEDRRIRSGHPWIFSNEVDTASSPLKSFTPGQEAIVIAHDKTVLGVAYVNPHSLIAGRIFSANPEDKLDQAFFERKLRHALELRERLFNKPYYRLVFSEADSLPGVVIDRFANDYVIQINTAGMELKKDMLVAALLSVCPDATSVLFRNDSQVREHEGLELYVKEAFGTPPEEIILEENNVRFSASLRKGQKTGWFYDHRLNRSRLQEYAKDKTVLDVFSYVGGFGIQAAAFGAKHVDCIEASASACEFITRNAEANQAADRVNVICDDVFDAMKQLMRDNKQYDVIIVDPPAFVKKFKDRKEGLLAYQRINEMALKLLVPGGILFSCSCSMHISMEDLVEMMQRLAYRTQTGVHILERGHQGPDHPVHVCIPETDYLKALVVRKLQK